MGKSLYNIKIESDSVPGSQLLNCSFYLIIRNPVKKILTCRGLFYYITINTTCKTLFMVVSKMIYSGIYHYFFQPAFKRTCRIVVRRLIEMYFLKDFKKAVVYNLKRVVIIIRIPLTNRHCITVK